MTAATPPCSTASSSPACLRYAASPCRAAPLIIAAPFSAIMIVSALVLVEVTAGITEASMTRSSPSSTALPCRSIIQVQLA